MNIAKIEGSSLDYVTTGVHPQQHKVFEGLTYMSEIRPTVTPDAWPTSITADALHHLHTTRIGRSEEVITPICPEPVPADVPQARPLTSIPLMIAGIPPADTENVATSVTRLSRSSLLKVLRISSI